MASTLTNLIFHVVFSTKNRAPICINGFRDELFKYMAGIIKGEGGSLLAVGGIEDHVHCVIKLKPKQSLSSIMQKLKGNSSKWANENNKSKCKFSWQSGYAGYSVSQSQLSSVTNYVKNQEAHHRKRSFKNEYLSLLEKHNIEYNESYLWS